MSLRYGRKSNVASENVRETMRQVAGVLYVGGDGEVAMVEALHLYASP